MPRWLAAGVLAVSVLPAFGFAQPGASVAAVKAAFLFNFAKFTEWPTLAPGASIVYCVVGDDNVADELSDTTRGQQIGGRRLDVRVAVDASRWTTCQILFVAESERARLGTSLVAIKKSPVLTVSDGARFAELDGISELYIEGGRMRFAINVSAAERAGLRLSSRLLSLAKVVRSDSVR